MEIVASLKDPTKAASDGSGFLLSDYRAMVHKFEQRIGFSHDTYFKNDGSALSQTEMDELERLTDSCCEMMRAFMKRLKEAAAYPRG